MTPGDRLHFVADDDMGNAEERIAIDEAAASRSSTAPPRRREAPVGNRRFISSPWCFLLCHAPVSEGPRLRAGCHRVSKRYSTLSVPGIGSARRVAKRRPKAASKSSRA